MNLKPGIVSLVRFPRSDLEKGKYRPIVLLSSLPGPFGDWLICALTSQLQHKVDDWDEVINASDPDFSTSGLKCPSLIRLGKLATVESAVLEGVLGEISSERLKRLLQRLGAYLQKQITATLR
ncbi:MAG: type II toxin-antitoxin system PemK/MazF family toxin [Thermodesulfovibrionales bacterium]|nr:type II toxin-antitoxin system PemK/MazF family toxin [Thermodesulfovibrionales bacterium]